MSWDFRGASFDHSAVGPNAQTHNYGSGETGRLRAELAALRAELVEADVDDGTREDALELVDDLDSAVAQETPDRGVVERNWRRLRTTLATGLPVAANLAQIAGLVNDIVSG